MKRYLFMAIGLSMFIASFADHYIVLPAEITPDNNTPNYSVFSKATSEPLFDTLYIPAPAGGKSMPSFGIPM